ncbi:MAG: VCBS repeat-containing protein [Balneolaceae bacterium]|nr:VCBS repeat-containing protein [Balneolaceae bacterium]MCH8549638.1 FG-GAP-like repeat-containing protein [Balneolaceae bacterium]
MQFKNLLYSLFLLLFLSCSPKEHHELYEFEWNDEPGYRWADLPQIEDGRDGFREIPGSWTGIDFVNSLTDDQIAYNRNLLNGSGIAVGDVTGNGFPDIYFCRLDGPNVLYENQGAFKFVDITEEAGVALPDQFSTGALFADLNGNGSLDLVVTSIDGPNRLFFNLGDGHFEESSNGLPASKNYGSKSIAAGDLSGNGALDLYITNYKVRSVRDIYPDGNEFSHIVQQVDGEFQLRPKFADHYYLDQRNNFLVWFETGESDLIYYNDGAGNFTKADLTSGMLLNEEGAPINEELLDWGLHVKIEDINQNGLQDIYVANDFDSPDRIWINQGDGTFRLLSNFAMRKSSLSSMAIDFSDINRNGLKDYFVVEMLSREHSLRHKQMNTMAPSPQPPGLIDNRPKYLGNTLFLNRGDTTWAEISEYSGVRRSDWSWSTSFMDVTLNGYEDILITNGHYLDVQDSDANAFIRSQINQGRMDMSRLMLHYTHLPNQNAAFQNNGDLTFTDVSTEWGFTEHDISHGMAISDLNGDGYPDIVINRLNDNASIFKNQSGKDRIYVRLKGELPNSRGGGALIKVEGAGVPQYKWTSISGGYLSSSEPGTVFATNNSESLTIEVQWPDGRVSTIEDVLPNRIYEIDQSFASAAADENHTVAEAEPLFEERDELIGFRHNQPAFDDMERQPLLSKRLSQSGPGVTLLDVNNDSFDDIFITSVNSSELNLFQNTQGDNFRPLSNSFTALPEEWEQSSILGWPGEEGVLHLLVGFSNYQSPRTGIPAAHYYRIEGGGELNHIQTLDGLTSAPGSISAADYSGNGYPDLFIAGSVNPGRYPEPSTSRLYLNDGNSFTPDEQNNALFENIGLINASVFSDLTNNGKPELILSEKWGSIRVFQVNDGRFEEITSQLGFDNYQGWWNGVATGDITGNGKLDIVATNWGENHEYVYKDGDSNYIYYRDLNQDGNIDILEAYYNNEIGALVPRRGLHYLSQFPPFIGNRIRSFREYSESSLEHILGHSLDHYDSVSADTYSHMVFLQQDDGSFEAKRLPDEAQFSPAFQPILADFTGDGNTDLFLSQNFFAYREEIPRSDAGRGLLMKGDGSGSFEVIPGQKSGIRIYGEQRGAAVGDLNNNGRLDLVVGQNAHDVKLFINQNAEPSLRVKLIGSSENPGAIGARLNLIFEDGSSSPVKEIQAGSGYRSQHSFVQLFANHREARQLQVVWPDGRTTQHDLRAEIDELVLNYRDAVSE